MKYSEILKKSWEYLKKYKFLWFLGILAGNSVGTSIYNGSGYRFDGQELEKIQDLNPIDATGEVVSASVNSVGKVLGESVSNTFSTQPVYFGILLAVIFIILLLIIYLSITSKGALVLSIDRLEEGKNASLKSSWTLGQKFFWRRLSFALLVFVVYFIPLLILSIPVLMLSIYEVWIPAVIFGILLFLIYLAYSVYLSLFVPYAERILFLDGKNAYEALKSGFKTLNHNWRELVLIYLIVLGITLAFGVALAIVSFFLLIIFGLISLFFYSLSTVLGIIIISVFGLAVFVALLIAGGGLSAYTSSVITMAYRSVRK